MIQTTEAKAGDIMYEDNDSLYTKSMQYLILITIEGPDDGAGASQVKARLIDYDVEADAKTMAAAQEASEAPGDRVGRYTIVMSPITLDLFQGETDATIIRWLADENEGRALRVAIERAFILGYVWERRGAPPPSNWIEILSRYCGLQDPQDEALKERVKDLLREAKSNGKQHSVETPKNRLSFAAEAAETELLQLMTSATSS